MISSSKPKIDAGNEEPAGRVSEKSQHTSPDPLTEGGSGVFKGDGSPSNIIVYL